MSDIVRDMMTALAICNNVTPVQQEPLVDLENVIDDRGHMRASVVEVHGTEQKKRRSTVKNERDGSFMKNREGSPFGKNENNKDEDDEEANTDPVLQASSPDEIALVKYGYKMKMKLIERERTFVTLKNANYDIETYDIIANFPFTSESKKMSCLVKSRQTGKYIHYTKGAEVVMENKIIPGARPSLLEHCENLAMEGLRTLVFAQKVLTKEQVEQFMSQLKKAQSKVKNREKHVLRVVNDLENGMDFIGVTGVEDKLQNNVESTIEALKSAGIQVWMLTGDKVETATSIAISSGLKSRLNELFFMRELGDYQEISDKLDRLTRQILRTTLIIDGKTLDSILPEQALKDRFFDIAIKAPCVCVCRCSPT